MITFLAHAGEAGGETTEMMEMMRQMMGIPWMTGSGWAWLGGILWLVTWGLLIASLVALVRWLWKKGG